MNGDNMFIFALGDAYLLPLIVFETGLVSPRGVNEVDGVVRDVGVAVERLWV